MADMSTTRDPRPEVPKKTAVPSSEAPQRAEKAAVESRSTEALQDARNNAQKGWFEENVYSKEMPVFGTMAKVLTLKPVEGIVNTATLNVNPMIGKVARWGTVAAAAGAGAWYLWPHLVAALGPGIAEVARRVSGVLSDSSTAEAAATATATDAAAPLGDYSTLAVPVEPMPLSDASPLRIDPGPASPGELGGGTTLPGGRRLR